MSAYSSFLDRMFILAYNAGTSDTQREGGNYVKVMIFVPVGIMFFTQNEPVINHLKFGRHVVDITFSRHLSFSLVSPKCQHL
jgi:hypothetical protein